MVKTKADTTYCQIQYHSFMTAIVATNKTMVFEFCEQIEKFRNSDPCQILWIILCYSTQNNTHPQAWSQLPSTSDLLRYPLEIHIVYLINILL